MKALHLRHFAVGIVLITSLLVAQTTAASSVWSETVTIVVPYSAGGGNDIAARALAKALTGKLAKSVIVENKPGAGGAIAVRSVMSAVPDGRILLLSASITEIQSGKENPLYDVSKDLAAVILCYEGQYTLYTSSALPIKSLQDLITYDKQNPGKLSYGSFGVGSGPHLAIEWLKQRTSTTMVHVPYRSNLEVINAILKQEVHLSLDTYMSISQYIQTGQLLPLATTGTVRDERGANLPTISESGIAGFEVTVASGIMAPLGTPTDIIATLNSAINDALSDPDFVKPVTALDFKPAGGPSARYEEALKRRVDTYRRIISNAGIKF